MEQNVYFFIGTEAELIKVFPVMMECMKRGMVCHLIASGQNDLTKSRILRELHLNGKLIELSKESQIKKSAGGLLKWFIGTYRIAGKRIKEAFDHAELEGAPMVVHGDTVSTFMGARIGRKLGCIVCHVEAGLRSHHLLNPFPEEIDRLLTSRIARVHFAPGDKPMQNLRKAKGDVINTKYNTISDSLEYSKNIPVATEGLESILLQDYFVFVMHRQENLANKEFVKRVIGQIKEIAARRKCVLILHKITETVFWKLRILPELKSNENFVLLPRVDYFDFMKLLDGAKYVITDGGSNQEELYHMGKPCLIMRKATERSEGISKNAILYDGDTKCISAFADEFSKYAIQSGEQKESPSMIISNYLSGICKHEPER